MNQTPKNQASLIWNIADILRGGLRFSVEEFNAAK